MAMDLYMVGLATGDLARSVDFYRQLGLDIPDDVGDKPHIEVKMRGELTFFLNAPGHAGIATRPGVLFEFYLPDRTAVEAKYAEMTGLGYHGERVPAVSPIGVYMAMLADPDGNTVVLSAD